MARARHSLMPNFVDLNNMKNVKNFINRHIDRQMDIINTHNGVAFYNLDIIFLYVK